MRNGKVVSEEVEKIVKGALPDGTRGLMVSGNSRFSMINSRFNDLMSLDFVSTVVFLLKRVPFVKRWREWRDINSSVD